MQAEVPSKVKYVEKIKTLQTPVSSESVTTAIASDDQQPPKKRKVTSDEVITFGDGKITDNHTTPVTWLSLSNIILTDDDQGIIVTGEELNDKHINYAQTLIKKQFKYVPGLMCTLLLTSIKCPPLTSGALQIIHT